MNVICVAFDSFGVKSSCVRVETGDVAVVIDPGIAVEAGSFPLPWREKVWLREEYEYSIRRACSESDVIVLTHYHFDHHIPDQGMYEGKTLLIKDPKENINKSQRGRAKRLLEALDADVRIADGESFRFGETKIEFSKPVWHGVRGTNLGYVLMVKVQDEEKSVLHTSDVDGPTLRETTDLIIRENPDILILDGPPAYLLGFIMAYYNLAKSVLNVCEILEGTNVELTILDHHLVRDYRYPDLLCEVYKRAKKLNKKVCTAAELLGKKTKVLEGYAKHGPTKWKNWNKFKKEDMINVIKNATDNNLIKKEWLLKAKKF